MMYHGTCDHGVPPLIALARVTAGLIAPPEASAMLAPAKTPSPQPKVISTHDAVSPSAFVRVSRTFATTPAPKRISTAVPRNSDRMMLPALTRTPAVEVDPVLATCRPDHPAAPATGDASGASHVVSIVVSDLGGRGGRRGAIGSQAGPRGCTACTVAGRG